MLLGIDIGGTTINLGLVNGTDIVRKACAPSFPAGATLAQTLESLSGRIEEIITPDVDCIGIGVPTLVDPEKGIVYDAMNIPSWKEVRLKEYLEGRFDARVEVNNDANCFALGAAATLGFRSRVTVGVTLGTGTGIGIVVDGKLMTGDNCGAGELCSVPYNGRDYESFCSKKFFEERGWGGREAAEAAQRGDPGALAFFEEFGTHMGHLLSLVMYAYDPGCIALGGGIANTEPWFRDAMMRTLESNYTYPHVLGRLQIHTLPSEDIALLGASLL
mgnify:CR=1 FL=1